MSNTNINDMLTYLKSPTCRFFNGYKPCPVAKKNNTQCPGKDCQPINRKLLVIEMGGLGSILRTTTVTEYYKHVYPDAYITFLTNSYGTNALQRSKSIDKVLEYNIDTLPVLLVERFDEIFNFEVAGNAAGLTTLINAKKKCGFALNEKGLPYLLNDQAFELYRFQVDDNFRQQNNKSVQQLLIESVGYKWMEQTYSIDLTNEDITFAHNFIRNNKLNDKTIIGLNIGSRKKHALKRWPADYFVQLANKIAAKKNIVPLIISGPDEIPVYKYIMQQVKNKNTIGTGYSNSVSEFFSLLNICDVVVSATTFGLIASIGLQKKVVAICSPKPIEEINTYGRGIKIAEKNEYNPFYSTKVSLNNSEEELSVGLKNIPVEYVEQAIYDALQNDFRNQKRFVITG